MPNSYAQCSYKDDTGYRCDVFFLSESPDHEYTGEQMCEMHRDTVSTSLAAQGVNKDSYIEKRREQEKICSEMSFEELDTHIAAIEAVIELEKMKLLTARATRSHKESLLNDEERAERRKIKIPKDAKIKSESKAKVKLTIKNNPLQYMMEVNGLSEDKAKDLLDLTDAEVASWKLKWI